MKCFLGGEPICGDSFVFSLTSKECEARKGVIRKTPLFVSGQLKEGGCLEKEVEISSISDGIYNSICCWK